MADKFPSLPLSSGKQRVFSIDLARFVVNKNERAAVVTAERERLVLYWSKADGSWGSHEIPHQALNLTPRAANESRNFRWTPRVGIVAAGDHLLLVYKRRFEGLGNNHLWLELFVFDATSDSFRPVQRVPFPREDLEIARFGWSLWADSTDEQLLIMVQAFFSGQTDDPKLLLLRTNLPLDAAALSDAANWRADVVDSGGWDFAVRLEGQSLAAIHRRVADSYSTDIAAADIGVEPVTIRLNEDPERVSRTLTEMVTQALVLVQIDLATNAIDINATLPFGENPQIHRVVPLIATIDRLQSGRIDMLMDELRVRNFKAERFLLKVTSTGWRAARLLHQQTNWPHDLEIFAPIQQALDVRLVNNNRYHIFWSALWSLRPIVLFKYEDKVDEKATLLTFGHQDSNLNALRATTFRVTEDESGDLKVQPETFTLLDIGHRHIAASENSDEELPEYQQLRPHRIRSSANHVRDFIVERREESGNTMNGFLVAALDRPESFYAYTEMGDGGLRVVFEGKLELPPPTTSVDEKEFEISWVSESPIPGRAWVRLSLSGYVNTDLPGYFISPMSLRPPSLATGMQEVLDALAFAADLKKGSGPVSSADPLTFPLPFGGEGRVHYGEAPEDDEPFNGEKIDLISLTPTSADSLQDELVELSRAEPPGPAVSEDNQPFRIEIRQPTGLRFANDILSFEGFVTGVAEADQSAYQFDWAVSDGTTSSGRTFSARFTPTLPDFSRANHGATRADITVTLTVTSPDDEVSAVDTSFDLSPSLWATLWQSYRAFRQPPDDAIDENGDLRLSDSEWENFLLPGMFVLSARLRFFRYRVRFMVDEDGNGTQVEIKNREVHDGRFRFLKNVSGQGDTVLEAPLHVTMDGVRLTGNFGGTIGNLIQINAVEKGFTLRQRFTTGVQTSEQRDTSSGSETIQDVPQNAAIPSALCCFPVGSSTLEHGRLTVNFSLTGLGWTLGVLVPAVIAAVGTALLLLILLPLLILAAPAALLVVIIGGGISAIVQFLLGAGLGAIATLLIQEGILRPHITNIIDEALSKQSVARILQGSGLFTYAGEGLAEAITLQLIAQAQEDGHGVADALGEGRDRFRSPFFEIIVIGEDECKAQLRV